MKINKKKEKRKRKSYKCFFYLLDLDQTKRSLSFDETDMNKKRPISPDRHLVNTTADERVSFSLEKDIFDDDKDEIVYSSTSNIM